MKCRLLMIIAVILMMACVSCRKTIYIPVEQRRSEVVIWHDTVVNIVQPGERVINKTIDTISTLHTRAASSTAVVVDGILTHTLTVHPTNDSVVVKWREVCVVDSVPYPVPVYEELSKPNSCNALPVFSIIISVLLLLLAITHRFRTKF